MQALTYIVERAHPNYAGQLPLALQARLIHSARGRSGINLDYFISTLRHLAELGIRERELERLMAVIGSHAARLSPPEGRARTPRPSCAWPSRAHRPAAPSCRKATAASCTDCISACSALPASAAGEGDERQDLEQHLRADLGGVAGRVVLRRHLDHVPAHDIEARATADELHALARDSAPRLPACRCPARKPDRGCRRRTTRRSGHRPQRCGFSRCRRDAARWNSSAWMTVMPLS